MIFNKITNRNIIKKIYQQLNINLSFSLVVIGRSLAIRVATSISTIDDDNRKIKLKDILPQVQSRLEEKTKTSLKFISSEDEEIKPNAIIDFIPYYESLFDPGSKILSRIDSLEVKVENLVLSNQNLVLSNQNLVLSNQNLILERQESFIKTFAQDLNSLLQLEKKFKDQRDVKIYFKSLRRDRNDMSHFFLVESCNVRPINLSKYVCEDCDSYDSPALFRYKLLTLKKFLISQKEYLFSNFDDKIKKIVEILLIEFSSIDNQELYKLKLNEDDKDMINIKISDIKKIFPDFSFDIS